VNEPAEGGSTADGPSESATSSYDHLVAPHGRLSDSFIWRRHRAFYDAQGIEAWTSGTIPWFVTSNASVARAYAQVIDGFLRDVADGAFGPIDPDAIVHIVEIGAGHGRLSYMLVERIAALAKAGEGQRFRYVMTDLAEANIAFWRAHPRLEAYFDAGVLDVARFDAEVDTTLELRVSGEVLGPGTAGPMVVIANYVLDSLLADVFVVQGHELHESHPAVYSTQPEPDLDAPGMLDRTCFVYERVLASETPYEDPEFDAILARYAEMLDETAFLFPVGSLRCLRNLDALSSGRTLLLSADKGYLDEAELEERAEPQLVTHGDAFSFSVNYHAIALWFLQRRGLVLATTPRDGALTINAFASGAMRPAVPRTVRAFGEFVEHFGPMDFAALQYDLRADTAMSVQALLALVRLGDYDAWLFYQCVDAIVDKLESPSAIVRAEVRRILPLVWRNHFALGPRHDLAFEIARAYSRIEAYEEALRFYGLSIEACGESPVTRYNMALNLFWSRRYRDALRCVDHAIELDPDYAPPRQLRPQIVERLT
jgi:tetratricopeptide (TPR) repeat protein